MKRIAFITFLWSCSINCFCQSHAIQLSETPGTVELKGSSDSWSVHVNSSGKQDNILVTFADRDRVYYYLANSEFKPLGRYSIDKDAMVANYYGPKYEMVLQSSDVNSFKNYIYGKKGNEIIVETINFDHNTSSTSDFLKFGNKEKFITAFEDNNHLYFLTLLRKTHKLRVYVDSINLAKEIELRIEDSILSINLEANLRNIVIIKNPKEPDLYTCINPTKLYIQGNGQVVLTLDSNFQYTTVFKIDLNNFTSESKFIRKSSFYCNSNEYADDVQSNSFVYQDKILQGVFCPDDLLLQWKNISNDSVLMEFHASRDSSIEFASSDLIEREEGHKINARRLFISRARPVSEQTERDLNSKAFFKAVKQSYFSFLVVPTDQYLVFKIGEAHDVPTPYGTYLMAKPLNNRINTREGIVAASASPWNNFGFNYGTTKMGEMQTYFKTVLKKTTMEFVPETDVQTKYDIIDKWQDRLKTWMLATVVFDYKQQTYLFYLDKNQHVFIIERID